MLGIGYFSHFKTFIVYVFLVVLDSRSIADNSFIKLYWHVFGDNNGEFACMPHTMSFGGADPGEEYTPKGSALLIGSH